MTADYAGLELLICTQVRLLIAKHKELAVNAMRTMLYDIKIHKWYISEERGSDIGESAAISDWNRKYGWITTAEFFEIERDYKKGVYREVTNELYDFARKNRKAILEAQKKSAKSKSRFCREYFKDPVRILEYMLIQKKSIDPTTEIALQVDCIKSEAQRYGNTDYNRAAINWARTHAKWWRDERYVNVLCFIIKVNEGRLREILVYDEKAGINKQASSA